MACDIDFSAELTKVSKYFTKPIISIWHTIVYTVAPKHSFLIKKLLGKTYIIKIKGANVSKEIFSKIIL